MGPHGADHHDHVCGQPGGVVAQFGQVGAGEGDVIRYVQPSEEQALADAGYQVVAKTGVGLSNQWFLRPAAPFLDDKGVRQALQHVIDRDAIVEGQYTESWTPATSVLSPGTFGYVDESAKFAFDPEAAAALLKHGIDPNAAGQG